jgi:hypothetical protein
MMNQDATTSESAPIERRETPAIDVARLVKLYKTTRAVDDI